MHPQEANLALPKAPIMFTKPRSALAGPYPASINIPKCAQDGTSDYEAELCIVIGKTGRDIPEEEALNYVLGYTASNDVSARSFQRITPQWSFSKGLDGSCPIGELLAFSSGNCKFNADSYESLLGPVLVSPSILHNPQKLSLKAIYNGDIVQNGQTEDMIFDVKRQISYLSQGTTLEAGSLILTGTPAGIGSLRQPRIVLRDGDEISIQISQIGTLVNKVRYDTR